MVRNICVYCGSSIGGKEIYRETAWELGRLLAKDHMRLIYGAGNVGLMDTIADSVLEHGGEVLGVIPQQLVEREHAHQGLTELIIVESMHERKAIMAGEADAFIAMPGGLGTLEELFEILTWNQLQIIDKPVGILNVDGFYDGLLDLVLFSHRQGFIREKDLSLYMADSDPAKLLNTLQEYIRRNGDTPLKVKP